MSEFDCQTCGACCAHYAVEDLSTIGKRGKGIFIGDDDVSNIPAKMVAVYPFYYSGHDAWLRAKRVDGQWRCVALDGQIGVKCSCSIYKVRPDTCRCFEPGSDGCLKARRSVLKTE
jgi:Fe-S-cluster containining protein